MKPRMWIATSLAVLLASVAAHAAPGNAHNAGGREAKLYRYLNSAWLLDHYSSKQQVTIRDISRDAAYVLSDPRRSQRRLAGLSASKQHALMQSFTNSAFINTQLNECTDPPAGTKICDLPYLPDCNLDGEQESSAQVAASCGYSGTPAAGVDDGMGHEVDYDPQYPTSTTGGPQDAAPRAMTVSLTGTKRKVACVHLTWLFIPMIGLCAKTNWDWHTPQVTYCADAGPGYYSVAPYTIGDVNGSNVTFTPGNGSCIHVTTATIGILSTKLPIVNKSWTIRQTLGNNGSSFWEGP